MNKMYLSTIVSVCVKIAKKKKRPLKGTFIYFKDITLYLHYLQITITQISNSY